VAGAPLRPDPGCSGHHRTERPRASLPQSMRTIFRLRASMTRDLVIRGSIQRRPRKSRGTHVARDIVPRLMLERVPADECKRGASSQRGHGVLPLSSCHGIGRPASASGKPANVHPRLDRSSRAPVYFQDVDVPWCGVRRGSARKASLPPQHVRRFRRNLYASLTPQLT
jgi:hypothetical protein